MFWPLWSDIQAENACYFQSYFQNASWHMQIHWHCYSAQSNTFDILRANLEYFHSVLLMLFRCCFKYEVPFIATPRLIIRRISPLTYQLHSLTFRCILPAAQMWEHALYWSTARHPPDPSIHCSVSLAPFSCPASANPLCCPLRGALRLSWPLPRRKPLPRAAVSSPWPPLPW